MITCRCKRACQAQMGERIQRRVSQFAPVIDDASELSRGLGMAAELSLRLSPQIRGPEFSDRRMVEPFDRLEQLERTGWLPTLDGGRGVDDRHDHVSRENRLGKASRQLA